MSKINQTNKEVIKTQILEALGDKYSSTTQIAQVIGRSWTYTLNCLKSLADEKKIEWIEVGRKSETLMAWRKIWKQ